MHNINGINCYVYDTGKHSERDLIKLEKEVNERQEVYFRAQPVFNKLNEWLSCWKEKLDMQRKVCRASFYNTRFFTKFIKSYLLFLITYYFKRWETKPKDQGFKS